MKSEVATCSSISAIIMFAYTVQALLDSQLVLRSNDCGCVIYQCTISGEGAIIWRGAAFDCMGTSNKLILLGDDQHTVECNNRTVKAQRKNNYTSLLIILNSSLSGSSIECIHDNGTNSNEIGTISDSVPNITTLSGRCMVLLQ